MEKTDFLAKISAGLASHGLKAETVKKYTDRVSSLLDELPPDELKTILSGGINVEAFVADLLKAEFIWCNKKEKYAPFYISGKNGCAVLCGVNAATATTAGNYEKIDY